MVSLKVIRPKEALVLTLLGKYIGTLKEAGIEVIAVIETRITYLAYVPEIASWAEDDFRSINGQIENLLKNYDPK